MHLFDEPGTRGCVANAIAFLALLFLLNLPASFLGLNFDDEAPDVILAPPGWLVVTAWLILFPAMGVARWMVATSASPGASRTASAIIALAVLCALYAYYTLGLERLTGVSAAVFGLAGNTLVIVIAIGVAIMARAASTRAALLISGVAIWTSFASFSVAQMVASLKR